MRRSFNYYVRQLAREARKAEAARKRELREVERQRKAKEREEQARLAELKRQAKESEKARKELEKLQKQIYVESRIREVEEMNLELNSRIESYRNLLLDTLQKDDTINFESLKPSKNFPPFTPPSELSEPLVAPREEDYLRAIKPPGGIAKLLPGAKKRYEDAVRQAREKYAQDHEQYVFLEESRKKRLEELKAEYEKKKHSFLEDIAARHREVDDFERRYRSGDTDAIVTYNSMVLERSEYPEEFPHQYRIVYLPESKELVVELDLPAPDVIPRELEYRYNKSKDSIEFKSRKDSEIKSLYQEIISSLALRTIHEVLEADQVNHIQIVTLNGVVDTIDLGTGNSIRPCIISLRVSRDEFLRINLSRVDKAACLRNLKAQISPQASEMIPVKPVVEFNMVDKRFIEQNDILAELDSRPNLMDLRPSEFENLVSNLFQQMGLESRLTRTSRDGGVDVVAFDIRPVIGGKVVIQAKRYKNAVGVSAVRDLYGTMLNEGANKGILVTTSGYGTDAYEFAKDKPIELIDGGGLLYLLEQIGVKARIVMPSA